MSFRIMSVAAVLGFTVAVTFPAVAEAGPLDAAAASATAATPSTYTPLPDQTPTALPLTSSLSNVPSAPPVQEPAKVMPLAATPAIAPTQPTK